MKRLLLLTTSTLLSVIALAQCTIEPWSLEKRVRYSDVVVEAKVIQQESFWNDAHDLIFTKNLLEVSAVFKGENVNSRLSLITEGGRVGLNAYVVEPSLQLRQNEQGIFLLKSSDFKHNGTSGYFKPTASVQSFLKYNLYEDKCYGYFEVFENIKKSLYPKIESYAGSKVKVLNDAFGMNGIRPLATPVISSLDLDTTTSGTGTVLTISGSNFGFAQGKGYVEFVDPNFGDGRYYEVHYPTSFKSWANSKIEIYVPTRAGSGKIRVTNNSQETGTSSDEIVIRYAHSNYSFTGQGSVDSGYFQPRHVNLDGNGGYRWTMSSNFSGKTDAVNAFYRSAENWRCGTLMNWDISTSTTNSTAATKDDINIVRFTRFGDSRLGVCGSWYSGCFINNGTDAQFYVSELDISFDSTRNWYYGEGSPATSQYDFETVATHELGHGHQLSHVIDKTKIMHYSLGNGERKTVLHQDDIDGGVYVRDASKDTRFCGQNAYKAITQDDCNITKPKAALEVNIQTPCPGTTVRFTNRTEGKFTSLAWDFGEDASTASATGAGPYNLSYSTSGEKTITLIATNDFGSDTATLKLTVQPGTPDTPTTFTTDTACTGMGPESYEIGSVTDATSYTWALASGGSINGSNADTSVLVDWTTAGDHTLSVTAKNACGTSDPLDVVVTVIDAANADFDYTQDGLEFTFTNKSTSYNTQSWNFGDGNTANEDNPSHGYTSRKVYTVELIVSNVCSADTVEMDVEAKFNVGLNDLTDSGVSIYPNPVTSDLTVEALENSSLHIYDALGKSVMVVEIEKGVSKLNLTTLESGVYQVQILTASGQNVGASILKK